MDDALGNAAALENKPCKDKERDGEQRKLGNSGKEIRRNSRDTQISSPNDKKRRDGDGNGNRCSEKQKSKEAEKKCYTNFSLPP